MMKWHSKNEDNFVESHGLLYFVLRIIVLQNEACVEQICVIATACFLFGPSHCGSVLAVFPSYLLL